MPERSIDADVRRNTFLLAAGMACLFAMTGLTAAVASITWVLVTGVDDLLGAAPALGLASAALAALPAGRAMDRFGRVPVLMAGFATAAAGCAVIAASAATAATLTAVAGFVLAGAGTGVVNLSRTAAGDMYPPERRARGVSLVIFGAVFGAALGPAVFTPLFAGRDLAADALVVPWLVGGLFMLAGMGIVWRVRPDPTVIAVRLEAAREGAGESRSGLTDALTIPSGIAAPAPAPGSGAAAPLGSGSAAAPFTPGGAAAAPLTPGGPAAATAPLTPGGAAAAAAPLAVEAPPRHEPVPAGVPVAEPAATLAGIIRRPGALAALLAASTCYAVMVAVMNLTGHVLVGHGHAQHSVFPVISAHLVGMFGLVLFVGDLVDRLGRGVAMRGGLLAIAVSCAMLSVVDSVPATAVALFGLGLGWSFAYVAATAELSEIAGPSERGRLLGFSDMLAGMSGAALALAGGYTLSTSGVVALAVGSALLAFVPVLVLTARRRPVAVA